MAIAGAAKAADRALVMGNIVVASDWLDSLELEYLERGCVGGRPTIGQTS